MFLPHLVTLRDLATGPVENNVHPQAATPRGIVTDSSGAWVCNAKVTLTGSLEDLPAPGLGTGVGTFSAQNQKLT